MKNLAIVTTPLQLLNLSEYLYLFPEINDIEIVAFIKKDNTNNQIQTISTLLGLKISKTIFIDRGKHFFFFKRFSKSLIEVDKLIIGHFFNDPLLYFINKLDYNELIVLDDGLANIHVKKAIEEKIPILKPNKLKRFLKSIFQLDTTFPDESTIFTLFNIAESQKIKVIKNELVRTKCLIGSKPIEESVLIIGQPFVELGEISHTDYLSIIKKIVQIGDSTQKLRYLAHRRENDNKLSDIAKIDQIFVERSEYNLELHYSLLDAIPCRIIGFTSTALITSKLITEKVVGTNIESIELPNKWIKKNQEKIESCYDEIRKFNIKIRKVN